MSDQGAAYRKEEVGYYEVFFMDILLKNGIEIGLGSKFKKEC